MSSLYEINSSIITAMERAEAEAIDNDGVISDYIADELEKLSATRDEKIGNTCKYYKSIVAEADMVSVEIEKLTKRKVAATKKADNVKKYLSQFLADGEKYTDGASKLSWRKSESTIIDNSDDVPDRYKKTTTTTKVVAADIKKAIKLGLTIPGAHIEEKQNLQIK